MSKESLYTLDKNVICGVCNKSFIKKSNGQKYCSITCRKKRERVNKRKNIIKICKECGKEFLTVGNSQRCSKECSVKNRKYLKSTNYKNLHTNFEHKRQHDKEYYQNNKEHIKKRICILHKHKLLYDKEYRIKCRLRTRMLQALENNNYKGSLLTLIGCSIKELKKHLQHTAENNSYINFNIENYNSKEYHIDHIIPCKVFDLTNYSEQKKCFHYSNLQILTALENMHKHAKVS